MSTSKNRTYNITVSDNEQNLFDMGFEADYLIDEMVELTYQTGAVWKYSEEAHRDYIREKMSIKEILDECNDLGVDLAEFETDEDQMKGETPRLKRRGRKEQKMYFDDNDNMILWRDLDWILTLHRAEKKKNDFDGSLKNAILVAQSKQNEGKL